MMITDRKYFVYWLRNASCTDVTKDGYVGVSWEPFERLKVHKRKKRFPPDFQMEIIFQGTQPECLLKETELRPFPGIGWNLARGGPNGYRHGHSLETRAKMRAAHLGQRDMMTPEARARLTESLKGRIVSAETRAKQRAAKLGRKQSDAQKAALIKINTGNKYRLGMGHTDETKARISASLAGNQHLLGNKHTQEARERIGAASRGKPRSPEVRAKIRAGHLARRRNKQLEEAASP